MPVLILELTTKAFLNHFVICIYDIVHSYEHFICNVSCNGRCVLDGVLDPDSIRSDPDPKI